MATYNTAFGALPSTKTLTGRAGSTGRMPADERRPRDRMQQYREAQQGAKQAAAVQEQTFADLQRQGRARPAPPTAAGMQQESPFLSQVQGVMTAPPITLNRTRPAQPTAPQAQPQVIPGPGPITSTAPTAGAPPAAPPVGTAPTTSRLPDQVRNVVTPSGTGVSSVPGGVLTKYGPTPGAETPPLDEGGDKATGSTTQTPVNPRGLPPFTPGTITPPTIAGTAGPERARIEYRGPGEMAPAGSLTPQRSEFLDSLRDIFGQLSAGASSQEQQAFEAQRKARTAELEAQFGAQRSSLEDELARRGLYASSIGGGRFGDLAGQQARALGSMEAEILNRQAELAAERQRTLMAGLQSAFATESDINMRALQLQQEERLRGRELSLQEARDRAQVEIQSGQLDLGYAEMGSRERIAQADIDMRAQQLQQEERLKGRELSLTEARDMAREQIDREELALRGRLGDQTFGLGRDQFIVDLIKAVGSGNVDPETLKKLLEQFGLKYAPGGAAGGGDEGDEGDEQDGGGNPADPNSWPPGSADGVERSTPDGTVYVYRTALQRWVPKPPPGDNGTDNTKA